jgi:hypothetical protein
MLLLIITAEVTGGIQRSKTTGTTVAISAIITALNSNDLTVFEILFNLLII